MIAQWGVSVAEACANIERNLPLFLEALRRGPEADRGAEESHPDWLVSLLRGLMKYSDEHPILYAQYAGSDEYKRAPCPCDLLIEVPADVLAKIDEERP